MWPIKITLPHSGADLGLKFLPNDYHCHAVFKCLADTFDIQHFSSVWTPTSNFKPFIAAICGSAHMRLWYKCEQQFQIQMFKFKLIYPLPKLTVWCENGHGKKEYNGHQPQCLFHCISAPSSPSTVDAVNGGTARGVGLTDGARKQREYSNYSSQFESSEMLQQSRTFAPIKSPILKKRN